ncbi:MAG: hydrogenase [Ignavibacterium sp.]|jgi:hydroxylaminobenzene mutase|uniref:hydrogenase n=1 Tax=Ignavibacterium sp. TaxID=2651167 RepID=UPI003299BDB1
MNKKTSQRHSHQLIVLGFVLFLLGLITGLLIPLFANPRMGLSSHIEGILNGMFLILLGLVWERISLPDKLLKLNFGAAVYGTFANWFGILFAAVFNAGGMLTIAADGKQGPQLIELIVNFSLISLSVAMIVVCILTITGLFKNKKSEAQNE